MIRVIDLNHETLRGSQRTSLPPRRASGHTIFSSTSVSYAWVCPCRLAPRWNSHFNPFQDPAGYASAAELSLFRRPLPMMNLRSLSTMMWDGRETENGLTLLESLKNQAAGATLGHAQAVVRPSEENLDLIVSDELLRVVAQSRDDVAKALDADGALGGPDQLLKQLDSQSVTGSSAFVRLPELRLSSTATV
jgi:hypothetical protein